ncbi:hypothetical protein P7C71_g3158, partial [Lecanoromycetidae sp. Uapishka_2]
MVNIGKPSQGCRQCKARKVKRAAAARETTESVQDILHQPTSLSAMALMSQYPSSEDHRRDLIVPAIVPARLYRDQ